MEPPLFKSTCADLEDLRSPKRIQENAAPKAEPVPMSGEMKIQLLAGSMLYHFGGVCLCVCVSTKVTSVFLGSLATSPVQPPKSFPCSLLIENLARAKEWLGTHQVWASGAAVELLTLRKT